MSDNTLVSTTVDSFKNIDNDAKISALLLMVDEVTNRVSWDEYFILIASVIKKRSSCDRLHVGCVITKNNTRKLLQKCINCATRRSLICNRRISQET